MLRSEVGDIWDYLPTHHVVIPTNVGWKREPPHANVMGRGLALQAAKKYPGLAEWYGELCRSHGEATGVAFYGEAPLILFPVKPLNVRQPWLSWRSRADVGLIERSASQLSKVEGGPVAVSMVGCGNGGLEMSDVRPILDKYLSDSRFVLVLFR